MLESILPLSRDRACLGAHSIASSSSGRFFGARGCLDTTERDDVSTQPGLRNHQPPTPSGERFVVFALEFCSERLRDGGAWTSARRRQDRCPALLDGRPPAFEMLLAGADAGQPARRLGRLAQPQWLRRRGVGVGRLAPPPRANLAFGAGSASKKYPDPACGFIWREQKSAA